MAGILLAAGLGAPLGALAWEPDKAVEFIVPAGTGGGADQMARLVQTIISKHNLMKQTMVVVNKSGGAGAEAGDLQFVLATLPEEQREVLRLRFVDGLSLAEVAEAMDIPLGTVKSRLHHALQTLRQDERTRKFFER